MPLTDTAIRKASPAAKPKKLSDERGLYLEVSPSGGKWWRLKYRFGGKEKRISLGTYPTTSLKAAREARERAREQLASGIDPGKARQALKHAAAVRDGDSLEAVAREWVGAVHGAKVTDAHAKRTLTRLEQDLFPWLGSAPLKAISAPDLLTCLRRVEARGAIETAHRLRQSCGQIFRYGIATGRCERNPAADVVDALRPVRVKHHAAIVEPSQVAQLMRSIEGYKGYPVTRIALQLAPLVFQRPGELRQAEWSEVNLDEAMWRIGSHRMKRTKQAKVSGSPHAVPLARQAVALLRELHALTGHGRFVFPSLRTGERPMSDNAVLSALRRMGYDKDEMSGHGFRAMARTLLVERLGVDEAVVEAQLAHGVRDSLGRAYNRAEFMDQRRKMMQRWADYLDDLRSPSHKTGERRRVKLQLVDD